MADFFAGLDVVIYQRSLSTNCRTHRSPP